MTHTFVIALKRSSETGRHRQAPVKTHLVEIVENRELFSTDTAREDPAVDPTPPNVVEPTGEVLSHVGNCRISLF